jgi:glutathione S-transferase
VGALVAYMGRRAAKGHGIGRHSIEDIYRITGKDVQAISEFLGNKPFLMGEKACSADASVFGHVSALLWSPFDSPLIQKAKSYPNLEAYCARVRDTFWPDWKEYLKPAGAKAFP